MSTFVHEEKRATCLPMCMRRSRQRVLMCIRRSVQSVHPCARGVKCNVSTNVKRLVRRAAFTPDIAKRM